MAMQWEYKVITLKRAGSFNFTNTAGDDETTSALNREGGQGWELVNAVCVGGWGHPVTFYLKRAR